MLDLTDKQQKFVVALLETAGENETRAAMMAGYGAGYHTRADELSRNPKILAAIREEADKRLRSGAVLAASKLIEIVKNNTHKDQLKACVELMNRGGLQVITTHKVVVEDNRSDNEIIARVAAFAKALDIDPRKVLASVGVDYTDAQFEPVIPGTALVVSGGRTMTVDELPEVIVDDLSDLLTPEEDDDDDA